MVPAAVRVARVPAATVPAATVPAATVPAAAAPVFVALPVARVMPGREGPPSVRAVLAGPAVWPGPARRVGRAHLADSRRPWIS
jgi:hypothetical protein